MMYVLYFICLYYGREYLGHQINLSIRTLFISVYIHINFYGHSQDFFFALNRVFQHFTVILWNERFLDS